MSTTFDAEYQRALGERGLALVSKRSAIQMKIDAERRRDELEEIVFGNANNYGIVSILSILYNQIWLMTGRATSKPLLHDFNQAKSQYQSNFALSVTPVGDGEGGLHPPMIDNPYAGQEDVDINSNWLTDHALETSPSGVMAVQPLIDAIGISASANSDARGIFDYQEDAEAQANIDRGSGILGARTENSEVYSDGGTQWRIGQNGIDAPDSFVKTNLISAFTFAKNTLTTLLLVLQQEVDLLNGANGDVLQEFRVVLPDDPDLNAFIIHIQDIIAQLQEYNDYFDQFDNPSPSSRRNEINAMLSTVSSYAGVVFSEFNSRLNSITSGMLGNASSGTREHLTFWISDIVEKPGGPYSMLLAANDMLEQAQTNLSRRNMRLNFFTSDRSLWIEIPPLQLVYDQATINLDQETINREETNIVWNLIMSANKYKVIQRPLSQLTLPLNNDLWDDSSGIWVTDKLPSTFLRNTLIIYPPTETTFFRLAAYDTLQGDSGDFDRMDDFDTNSFQSDIVSKFIPFAQKDNTEAGQSVIEVNASTELRERDFLLINGSAIAQVMATTDDQHALDTDYGEIQQVQKLYGIYYMEPAE